MTLIEDIEIQYLTFVDQASAPATPASGRSIVYPRTSDGHWVRKDSAGVVTDIEAGGGGGGGGGSGALVLLEQHAAAGSADLQFTTAFTSTYDDYVFRLLGILPATDAVNLHMRVSTDGGATWDSGGAIYEHDRYGWRQGGAGSDGAGTDSKIVLSWNAGVGIANAAAQGGLHGELNLMEPLGTTAYKRIFGQVNHYMVGGATAFIGVQVQGSYLSTTAVNGVQFFFSSGNIASGIIRCYGVAKV